LLSQVLPQEQHLQEQQHLPVEVTNHPIPVLQALQQGQLERWYRQQVRLAQWLLLHRLQVRIRLPCCNRSEK
jgi:hypothetical protein